MVVARGVDRIEKSRQMREGGGFLVRRPIGDRIDQCDPFLMLDHLGPVVYGPGEAVGAPDHPHRGFETVSYLIDGEIKHQDSAGNSGVLKEGWVQWMTAGSGVVHSEMPSDEFLKRGGKSEGFQLWVNLPAKDKMIKARYQDTDTKKIPVVSSPDGKTKVKVIAGESLGAKAVIDTRTPIMFLDIHVQAGGTFVQDVPEEFNGFAYVWRGAGSFTEERISVEMGMVAVLGKGNTFQINASPSEDIHVLVIAGVPLKEAIARHGPFVMNTWEEIEQAFSDFQSGKLGSIAGSEERYAKTQKAVSKQKASGTWNKK
ncbi:pirin-like protein [Orbicella faveolata]|uniref:pirin-like protein n=1 Tax=Orbicella faveolata TaxID=48498 RepID=UPI0009E36809|nr:pirin-like protein [Orbicella faveolata]